MRIFEVVTKSGHVLIHATRLVLAKHLLFYDADGLVVVVDSWKTVTEVGTTTLPFFELEK